VFTVLLRFNLFRPFSSTPHPHTLSHSLPTLFLPPPTPLKIFSDSPYPNKTLAKFLRILILRDFTHLDTIFSSTFFSPSPHLPLSFLLLLASLSALILPLPPLLHSISTPPPPISFLIPVASFPDSRVYVSRFPAFDYTVRQLYGYSTYCLPSLPPPQSFT
jgi:hypothetical protein